MLLDSPPFSLKVATPSANVTSPYSPLIVVSPSVTVNSNSLSASAARSDSTVLVTSRSPVLRVFVNAAVDAVVLIVPVSPVFVVVNPSASASTTVYSVPMGRPVMVLNSPPFRVMVPTPYSSNVTSLYVPAKSCSPFLRVIVKVKIFSLSAAASETTVLFIVSSPVLRVFLKAAVDAVLVIVPVSPVCVVVNSVSASSDTV